MLREPELRKYEFIRDSLLDMLQNFESYLESDWQKIILNFLLLIFPKYVAVLPDFEIIKRKLANIIDIMTYEDLLQRLDNIISKFQNDTFMPVQT